MMKCKWTALCLAFCLAALAGCARTQTPPAAGGDMPLTGDSAGGEPGPGEETEPESDPADTNDRPTVTEPPANPEPEPVYFEPEWESDFTQESVVDRNVYSNYQYRSFNRAATATYLIPGLKQHFIPQGMDVWQE